MKKKTDVYIGSVCWPELVQPEIKVDDDGIVLIQYYKFDVEFLEWLVERIGGYGWGDCVVTIEPVEDEQEQEQE